MHPIYRHEMKKMAGIFPSVVLGAVAIFFLDILFKGLITGMWPINTIYWENLGNSYMELSALGILWVNSIFGSLFYSKIKNDCIHSIQKPSIAPIHIAANQQNWDEVFKLSQTENVNCKDLDGNSILHKAILAKNKEIIFKLLQQEGIDVNLKNNLHNTPLSLAIQHFPDAEILIALLHAKASLHTLNKNGKSPLMLASESPELVPIFKSYMIYNHNQQIKSVEGGSLSNYELGENSWASPETFNLPEPSIEEITAAPETVQRLLSSMSTSQELIRISEQMKLLCGEKYIDRYGGQPPKEWQENALKMLIAIMKQIDKAENIDEKAIYCTKLKDAFLNCTHGTSTELEILYCEIVEPSQANDQFLDSIEKLMLVGATGDEKKALFAQIHRVCEATSDDNIASQKMLSGILQRLEHMPEGHERQALCIELKRILFLPKVLDSLQALHRQIVRSHLNSYETVLTNALIRFRREMRDTIIFTHCRLNQYGKEDQHNRSSQVYFCRLNPIVFHLPKSPLAHVDQRYDLFAQKEKESIICQEFQKKYTIEAVVEMLKEKFPLQMIKWAQERYGKENYDILGEDGFLKFSIVLEFLVAHKIIRNKSAA